MTHADEARRIVDAMKTCQTNHPEKWLEPIAAALADAERAGIERAAEVLDRAATEWTRRNVDIAKTNYAKGKTYRLAIECERQARAIRALLPAAVAEPAAKCGMGLSSVFVGTNGELPPQESHPVAKCATPCLICGGKKRVCYHADACVASQYPLSGRCIASAGECRMVPPCVAFEVDCPSCLKCANPECVNGEVPSNQGGWMSPVPCSSCGGAR